MILRNVFVVVMLVILIGCADAPRATSSIVTEHEVDHGDREQAPGAAETEIPGLSGRPVGVEVPDIDGRRDATTRQADAAVMVGTDLLEGFVRYLANGDIAAAATTTTGDAQLFLQHLEAVTACGVEVSGAELTAGPSGAALVGPSTFAVTAAAEVDFGSAGPRTLSEFRLKELGDSSWLISDFLVNGQPWKSVAIDLGSTLRNGLRLTPIDLCVGPTVARATYQVANETDRPIFVADASYCDSTGSRRELTDATLGALIGSSIPANSVLDTPWSIEVDLATPTAGGNLALFAPDPGKADRGELFYVRREFPLMLSPLFTKATDPPTPSSVDDLVKERVLCEPDPELGNR